MACAKMELESIGDETTDDDDISLQLKVCVVNKACGVNAQNEIEGVSVKFDCSVEGEGAQKLVATLVAMAAAVVAVVARASAAPPPTRHHLTTPAGVRTHQSRPRQSFNTCATIAASTAAVTPDLLSSQQQN